MKLISLRQDDTCAACYGGIAVSTQAWWDTARGHVVCIRCRPVEFTLVDADQSTLNSTTADELAVSQSRAASMARHPSTTGRVGTGSGRPDELPLHVAAWEHRAAEERRLRDYLDQIAGGTAVVLHDRVGPDAGVTIDHLVIAPSGIWVIDATRFAGRIGYRSSDLVHPNVSDLQVGPRREAKLLAGMAELCAAVRDAVEPIRMGGVPIRPAVCFTHSHWPSSDHVETIHEVIVAPPTALGAAILTGGLVEPDTINTLAAQLATALPATTAA